MVDFKAFYQNLPKELLDTFICAIIGINNDVIIYHNAEALRITGYSTTELTALPHGLKSLIHPDDLNKFRHVLHPTNENSIEKTPIIRLVCKHNRIAWIEIKATQASSDNSSVIYSFVDRSDSVSKELQHKEMERALKQSEKRYKYLTEHLGEGIGVVDENEIFTYANPAAASIFGLSIEDMIGKSLHDFTTPEQFEIILQQTKKRKVGNVNNYELTITNALSEQRVLLVTASPYCDDCGIFVAAMAIFRDITDRKEAEHILQKSEKELLELNFEKDRLISIIGHDLKNPLSAIAGFSDLLINSVHENNTEKIESHLLYINETSNSVISLLDNLIDWSKLQRKRITHYPVKFDLYRIVEKCITLFKAQMSRKKITLCNEIITDSQMFADSYMIEAIFRNLLSNAVKFTPKEGKITLSSYSNESYHYVSVANTGKGISSTELQKLFNADIIHSTTGTASEQGNGLGLVICKEFVEKNQGTIKVESEINKETVFTFTIPKQTATT